MSEKAQLRNKFIAIRKNLGDKESKDEKIFNRLTAIDEIKEADFILAYASSPIEVDTYRFIEYTLRKGQKIALPVCLENANEMDFYLIESPDCLIPGKYKGIYEPDTSRCQKCEITDNTVCIVPGLSFDKNGYRLGYGKGYYDRFLAENPVFTVGLCYEECVSESLPFEEHDKCVSVLVTEKEIYKENVYGRTK
ncbi:MAG: 5-formyltetrahydrofolate cyclo-ligase [Acutalibacteraceae bacterium]